eukprot:scaffold1223_cov119-Cylindrotheca_fusiformis.AAC.6
MPYQEDEDDRFNFEWSGVYHPSFRYGRHELNALMNSQATTSSIPTPGTFHIRSPDWDDELLRIFMELFEYFSSQGILWECFGLSLHAAYDDQSWRYVRPFLAAANARSIFRRLRLEIHLIFGPDDPPDPNRAFLLAGVDLNQNLESIDLRLRGSRESFFRVTKGDFQTLSRLLQTTQRLRSVSFSGMAEFDHNLFCEGLADNCSVQEFAFDFFGCDISDESTATLIAALSQKQQQQLQSLTLIPSHYSSEWTSKALRDLLVSSTSLQYLELSHMKHGPLRLDPELLLQGIERNQSLRYLKTSTVFREDLDLTRLFRSLKYRSPLEQLDITDPISDDDLKRLSTLDQLNRPISLTLPYDEIKEHTAAIERMLICHSEIRLRPCYKRNDEGLISLGLSRRSVDLLVSLLSSDLWLSQSLKHVWDFNWYGRYLLDRPAQIPLGLWPLVLEKIEREHSIVFEILKGPAFVARNAQCR